MSNWNQLSWVKICIELIIGAAIAILLYLATMNLAVSKALLFSIDAKRIIEIQRFCSSIGMSAHNYSIFIVGSSIAVEGIDAGLLDKTLNNGTVAYNFGVVGLTPVEALILEPALATGRPQIAVIGIDAMSLGVDTTSVNKEGIDFEKLQAYRATDSTTKMEGQVKKELLENILFLNEREIIESSYLKYLIDCRSLPIFFTESKFREVMRKELRTEGSTTNFKSPWMLKSSLTGAPKERLISSTVEKARRLRFDENNRQIKALRALTSSLRARNIDLMLVLWPVHPRILSNFSPDLINSADAMLQEIAQANKCAYKNYSSLLSDSEFADALHPNLEGRTKLSASLAVNLKTYYSPLARIKGDDLR